MTGVAFRETSGEPQVQSLPLGHVSIEVGHLYHEDFAAGPGRLSEYFGQVAPWLAATRSIWADRLAPKRARISTCFLIDDYSVALGPPAEVVPQLLAAARGAGVAIDYLAREAACANADGVPLARLVEERIVAEPIPGTNGGRPPATEVGWLSNGRRSPAAPAAAMAAVATWSPPAESAANRHSVFVDVELWDDLAGTRTWSCAYLAAVWQLLRLGLLRSRGAPVAVPQPYDEGQLSTDWDRLPAVIRLNPDAAPFTAYQTVSILPRRFLPTEHAVRTILGQVAVERAVLDDTINRARAEQLEITSELVDRMEYIFTG
ncbi:MAG TPA: SCO2522 family protein [Natronosporangium sp.]